MGKNKISIIYKNKRDKDEKLSYSKQSLKN